jgi:hypothetical protein
VVSLVVAAFETRGRNLVSTPFEIVERNENAKKTNILVNADLVAVGIFLVTRSALYSPTPRSTMLSQSSLLRKYSSMVSMTEATFSFCSERQAECERNRSGQPLERAIGAIGNRAEGREGRDERHRLSQTADRRASGRASGCS